MQKLIKLLDSWQTVCKKGQNYQKAVINKYSLYDIL